MSQSANLFQSPAVRWGMPLMTTIAILAIALFIIEDQIVRLAMVGVAAADLVVTPQILKRAARSS